VLTNAVDDPRRWLHGRVFDMFYGRVLSFTMPAWSPHGEGPAMRSSSP
jgi:hypothetical protein